MQLIRVLMLVSTLILCSCAGQQPDTSLGSSVQAVMAEQIIPTPDAGDAPMQGLNAQVSARNMKAYETGEPQKKPQAKPTAWLFTTNNGSSGGGEK